LTVGFEQAVIKVDKAAQFAELKATIERVFAQASVETFLKRMASEGIRIRNFEGVLEKQALEHVDGELKKAGKTAKGLYQELTVSDQGQMREFYLSKIEQVDVAVRHKFRRIYQYY
jgi:hypothetical protein